MKNIIKLFSTLLICIVLVFSAVACNNSGSIEKQSQTENSSISENSTSKQSVSKNDNFVSSTSNSTSSIAKSESSASTSATNSTSQSGTKTNAKADGIEKINDSATFFNANGSTNVSIIKTVYNTSETVIASLIGGIDFSIDASGETDASNALQNALNDVCLQGGGTVFLPKGKYLITKTIVIPQYVTLRGDWQNPNSSENIEYGTIILAQPSELLPSQKPQDNPLFSMLNNSGIVGITVFYTEQNIDSVKKFGYSIYANEPTKLTVKNLTLLNACYGIGVSLNSNYNELCCIENFYATSLYNAIAHNGLTDVGSYNNVKISPEYWVTAKAAFKCLNATKLNNFLSSNLEALILGDLDDQLLSNIEISNCKTAFKFVSGIRANSGFWGLIYNATVKNAVCGVLAEELSSRSGAVFTSSSVGKIVNNATAGVIKLCDTEKTSVEGVGKTVEEKNSEDLSAYSFEERSNFVQTNNISYIKPTSTDDVSTELQTSLNALSSKGGILVVANGVYNLKNTVSIPKNVEMCSELGVFARTSQSQKATNGVTFLSYVNGVSFSLGENSGVKGIRIWHAQNSPTTALTTLKNQRQNTASSVVSIKSTSSGAYAFDVESVGAYTAFDFSNCDNHLVKNCYGLAYLTFIKAGGSNGQIINCLANPNFITRSNLYNLISDSYKLDWQSFVGNESNDKFSLIRDDIGRTYTKMVELSTSSNQLVLNTFCYGESGLFTINGAENALLINTSLDFIPSDKAVYTINSGSASIIGSLRVYGYSINFNGGSLKAFGRIAFGEVKEQGYNSALNVEDVIVYASENATRKTLFDCESVPQNSNGITLNKNATYIKYGSGSWSHLNGASGNVAQINFDSFDASEYKYGYLHLSVYVSDVSKLNDGQIEISSSGTCDQNELSWSVKSSLTKNGWNDVWLDVYAGGVTGGKINLASVNFMRIYSVGSTCDIYIDQIEFVKD